MPYPKNHIRLTESALVRFTKEDMKYLHQTAKKKRISIASFIRSVVMEYLEENKQILRLRR